MVATSHPTTPLPGSALDSDRMAGHWLLARLGKRVLRPGGRELTDRLLAALDIGESDDVVELAPGLGATTESVLARNPRTYLGVDRDPDVTRRVADMLSKPGWSVVQASATETGKADGSTDIAFGEAYLTMQTERLKREVAAELARIVRPGGRIGLHEIAVVPDDIDPVSVERIERDLTGTIKVSVHPLTVSGWIALFDEAGFDIEQRFSAPLALLEPRRLIADEGLVGSARFVTNVVREPAARRRVTAMRAAMRSNADHLQALALTARRRSA